MRYESRPLSLEDAVDLFRRFDEQALSCAIAATWHEDGADYTVAVDLEDEPGELVEEIMEAVQEMDDPAQIRLGDRRLIIH